MPEFTMRTVWINSWGTKAHWKARTIDQIRFGLHMGARIGYLPLDAAVRTKELQNYLYLHPEDRGKLVPE